ncbi:MAG: hypothetical protein WCR48_00625 [Bacteroidales bacterium]
MKKTLTILLLSFMAANAGAQTMYDALRFSTNDYKGTARTMGMGNAVTAVGGDIGSITINPAGSVVAPYSQFTISPGVSVAVSKASFAPVAGTDAYGNELSDNNTKMTFPNFGYTFYFKQPSGSLLRGVTIGIAGNQTNNYLKTMGTGGTNDQTSFMGALATNANSEGFTSEVLNASDAYYNSNASWNSILAYQSGMISSYTDKGNEFIGSTETLFSDNNISIGGPLNQRFGQSQSGNKYDIVFNAGFNLGDIVYLGANLGVTSMNFTYDEYAKEIAVDPANFEIDFGTSGKTNFNNGRYRYAYDADGSGFYGKFGIIVTPTDGLRIGAAIQTPTTLEITEHWSSAGETHFNNSSFDASAQTPQGEYRYKLQTPYRANFGLAYAFGQYGMLSVDYEMCDYSSMKFKVKDSNDNYEFDNVNSDISQYTKVSSLLRIGGEIKVTPQFAVRAGYNLTTTPESGFDTAGKKVSNGVLSLMERYYDDNAKTQSFSFGFGYSSNSSFFTDIACKYTQYAKEYMFPYYDYIDGVNSPVILNKAGLWDIVWTLGFRF